MHVLTCVLSLGWTQSLGAWPGTRAEGPKERERERERERAEGQTRAGGPWLGEGNWGSSKEEVQFSRSAHFTLSVLFLPVSTKTPKNLNPPLKTIGLALGNAFDSAKIRLGSRLSRNPNTG